MSTYVYNITKNTRSSKNVKNVTQAPISKTIITEEFSSTVSPTSSRPDFVHSPCTCPCDGRQNIWYNFFNGNLTPEEKNNIIDQEKERIKRELFIDTSELSSHWRRKKSATDNRPAVVSMGLLGVLVLCSVILVIIIGDVTYCCHHAQVAKTLKK